MISHGYVVANIINSKNESKSQRPLTINTLITNDHFKVTFMFPNGLDFIGKSTRLKFFVDCFNDMIDKRLKEKEFKPRFYKRQTREQIKYDERS